MNALGPTQLTSHFRLHRPPAIPRIASHPGTKDEAVDMCSVFREAVHASSTTPAVDVYPNITVVDTNLHTKGHQCAVRAPIHIRIHIGVTRLYPAHYRQWRDCLHGNVGESTAKGWRRMGQSLKGSAGGSGRTSAVTWLDA